MATSEQIETWAKDAIARDMDAGNYMREILELRAETKLRRENEPKLEDAIARLKVKAA